MAIKKAYQEIVAFLEENADKKVKSIINDVVAMASAKSGGGGGGATTFHKNADGVVVAVRCLYHKLWMSPEVAEFGAKASSPTGLNSMCKDGVSKWSKQQRDAKNAKESLLAQVAAGEIEASNLGAELDAIEEARNVVEAREDGYGFAELEDCLADNAARGLAA